VRRASGHYLLVVYSHGWQSWRAEVTFAPRHPRRTDTFGFAAAIFRKHFGGELTATIVAKIADAPNIDDVRLPFFVETPTLRNA
jgi:hypothetical protein